MASASNERQIRARNKRAKADAALDEIVIRSLMSAPSGRRWVWNRLAEAQIFIEGESLEPAVLAYQKGLRNSGLRLLASVTRITPEDYITMTKENTSFGKEEEDERSEHGFADGGSGAGPGYDDPDGGN